jgi:hypothetical protein
MSKLLGLDETHTHGSLWGFGSGIATLQGTKFRWFVMHS